MPSLFSSRRRGSSANPPVDRSSSNAATAAAGQAFLGKAASSANLSASAAAAALRSQTSSPEPVGNVQTKRMQRRGSVSSTGSGSVIGSGTRGGVGRGGLQRTNSGGSMTDRTFRSPSPGRQNSSGGQADARRGAPPVPAIPNGHRRSASLDPPQRVLSPTPAQGKRGSSVDRASAPQVTPRSAKRLSNVFEEEQITGDEPAPSSPSRNFSRPMSRDGNNTIAAASKSKHTHGQGSWFTQAASTPNAEAKGRPRTSDGNPAGGAGVEIPITNPRNKKRISSAPGTHLSQANRNSVASSVASEEADSVMVFDPNTRTFITKRREQPDVPHSPIKSRNEQVYDPNTRSFISRGEADAQPEVPAARPPAQAPATKKTKPAVAALDTTLQPPPKNPARYSPSSESPSSPRAMGFLHKQPSVVREDREGEEEAEATLPKSAQSTKSSRSTTTPAKAYTSGASKAHARSSSLDVPRGEQTARGRNTSLSPQRSTRFSPSPVMDSTRHDPPGRDVSPVKSALKHSPSSSVRGNSPLPSESDAMSDVGSQDGLTPKRKKSVRVSFDEHAQEIAAGGAAPAEDNVSDDDAIMKPRPALPSFGSVRRQGMSPEPAEKVTEMAPDREGSSSDAALGGIMAGSLRGEGKKVERESSSHEPLPPEVTSRDAADFGSDTDSEANVSAPTTTETDPTVSETRDFAEATTSAAFDDDAHVPQIALQPPTPGVEDDSKKDLQQTEEIDEKTRRRNRLSRDLTMPGGWGNDEDEPVAEQQAPVQDTKPEPTRRSSSEDSAATQTITPLHPVAEARPQSSHELSDIYEDSDDSGEFSDAAEDPSEFEDGGFASLDAIVESPMITSTPLPKKANLEDVDEADESPTARKSDERAKSGGDWGEATAYWSNLSRQQREQIERDHLSEDDDEPRSAPTKAKKKKPATGPAPLKPALKQTNQGPAQASGMRKSMRAQSGPAPAPAEDTGVHMRRSMRSGGSGGGGMMAASLRDNPPHSRPRPQSDNYSEPKGTLQKKDMRPMSSQGLPASAGGSAMRQSMRPGSADSSNRPLPLDSSYPPLSNKRASQQSIPQQKKADPPQVSARLQKELAKADDSDSESSFRKQRRAKRAASVSTMDSRGGYSMRKSMRGGPEEPAANAAPPPRPASPEAPRGSKWRMRSLSPTGSLFGRKQLQASRASVDSGPRTTLRNSGPPPAARQRPSTASSAAPPRASKFKSRFASDSDDEDDARPARTFRSRFADSDDEDDGPAAAPVNLTPVRGIPKRKGQEDGDSTDLEEEEDDDPRKASRQRQKQAIPLVPDPSDVEKAMAAARRNLGMQEDKGEEQPSTQGNALQQGSLRKKQNDDTPQASPKAAQSASTQPLQEKKKRSFMGSILRRNRNSQASIPQVAASPSVVAASPQADEAPATPSSPSSPAAKKLQRNSSYQNQPTRPRRGDSDLSTATAPEMYSSTNRDSGNWPLAANTPPVPKIPEHLSNGATPVDGGSSPTSPTQFRDATETQEEPKGRPSTSDGVSESRRGGGGSGNEIKLARTMRPSAGQRTASEQISSGSQRRRASGGHVSFLAGDEGSEPGERPADVVKGSPVYSRRTGKKKKFGMLRRAFGLDD